MRQVSEMLEVGLDLIGRWFSMEPIGGGDGCGGEPEEVMAHDTFAFGLV